MGWGDGTWQWPMDDPSTGSVGATVPPCAFGGVSRRPRRVDGDDCNASVVMHSIHLFAKLRSRYGHKWQSLSLSLKNISTLTFVTILTALIFIPSIKGRKASILLCMHGNLQEMSEEGLLVLVWLICFILMPFFNVRLPKLWG